MIARQMLPVLVVFAVACSDSPASPLGDLQVSTDRTAYGIGEHISVSVENITEANAFFYHCNHRFSLVLQQRSEGEWAESVHVNGPACPAIYASGVAVLLPATAHLDTFSIDRAGTYRVRFETGTNSNAVGSQLLYSNVFEVKSVL